jgi:pimeloyl-ACP methyl ester carboxylesterase
LADLSADGTDLDLDRVVVAGHSSGGHLAFWNLARPPKDGPLHRPVRVHPRAVAGLAAILDLPRAFSLDSGDGAVAALLGGPPDQHPDRYAAASPMALLPLGVGQLILHGGRDEALPIALARDYVAAARASGDNVEFTELPLAGHMDYLDPHSEAHALFCAWLARITTAAVRQ